jgi:hypothetical protein
LKSNGNVSYSSNGTLHSSSSTAGNGVGGGATLKVPTLDLSIDMVKRLMIRDPYLLSQLNLRTQAKTTFDIVLGTSKPFKLGRMMYDEAVGCEVFEAFDFVRSLKEVGVKNGGDIAVFVEDGYLGEEEDSFR